MSKRVEELNCNPKPMLYATMYSNLKEIAAKCGYALAVHGSLANDMDLIAVRWNEKYEKPLYLVEQMVKFLVDESWHRKFIDNLIDLTNPEYRFGNQIHYTIPIIGDWFIDLTVITNDDK